MKPVLTVSNSYLNSFTACQRRWYYSEILGLHSKRKAIALRFGTLWHSVQESYWETLQQCKRQPNKKVFLEYLENKLSLWLKSQQEYAASLVEAGQMEEAQFEIFDEYPAKMELVSKMIVRNFLKNVKNDFNRFKVVAVEARYSVPLYEIDKGEESVLDGVNYSGIIDVVLQDNRTDKIILMDHKTTASKSPSSLRVELLHSPQPISYMWLYEKAFGVTPSSFIFNVSRKAIEAEPMVKKVAKDDKYSDGVKLKISQSKGTDTTYEAYLAAIHTHDAENEKSYKHTLDYLKARGDVFDYRFELYSNPKLNEDWHIERMQVVDEIKYIIESHLEGSDVSGMCSKDYTNCKKYNSLCPYYLICHDPEKGNYEMFDQKEFSLTPHEIEESEDGDSDN